MRIDCQDKGGSGPTRPMYHVVPLVSVGPFLFVLDKTQTLSTQFADLTKNRVKSGRRTLGVNEIQLASQTQRKSVMPIDPTLMEVAEIVHLGTVAADGATTKNFANVYHFARTSVVNPWSNTAIANEFISAILPDVVACLNVDYVTTGVSCRCINDATDIGVSVSVGLPGLVAGDQMPDVNAAFIYHQAPFRGRQYKGSVHLGPLSEADTTSATENIFNAAAITRFTNVMNAYLGPITDASPNTFNLETVSRVKSLLKVNPTTVVATPVGSVLLNKRIGRLRGRERREGSVY